LSDATAPPSVVASLQAGERVEVLFDVDTLSLDAEAFAMAHGAGRATLGQNEWAYRRAGLASLKQDALSGLEDVTVLATWEHLSTGLLLVETQAALQALLARPEVLRVHANEAEFDLFSDESLPMIGQDVVVAHAGKAPAMLGEGSVVAILDTGVDYLDPFFGCTGVGVPSDCPIVAVEESAPNDNELDSSGHGTTVSAIVNLVAPKAQLVVADMISTSEDKASNAISAFEWLIGLKTAEVSPLNIVAVNMSWGIKGAVPPNPWFETQQECEASALATALAELMNDYQIQPIAASGNQGQGADLAFHDGVADPACVAGVVSVGAVYDDELGQDFDANYCTEATANEDKVSCFSQTATFLSILAPGARINTANANSGDHTIGTSFAAPHVAGAWAVLRSVFPSTETRQETLDRLTRTGRDVNDHRVLPNGRIKPRLDLLAALDEPDGDGVPLLADNCNQDSNPGMYSCDADFDGFGNVCDCDLTQNGICNTDDIPPMKAALVANDPVGDINCDGVANTGDLDDFKALITNPHRPGPSGLACAGTAPCTP
jgi:subtilisin family serine protease